MLEAVDIPIILYSVPKFTGYALEPSTIAELANEYSQVASVKDSSGNIAAITETIRLVGHRIAVLAGTADLVLSTLALGGKGAVIAVANPYPELQKPIQSHQKRRPPESSRTPKSFKPHKRSARQTLQPAFSHKKGHVNAGAASGLPTKTSPTTR